MTSAHFCALLVVPFSHVSRLTTFISEHYTEFLQLSRIDGHVDAVLVTETGGEKDVLLRCLRQLSSLAFVQRVLDSIVPVRCQPQFQFPFDVAQRSDVLGVLTEMAPTLLESVHRLVVWPASQLYPIGEAFHSLGVKFHPKKYTHVLAVICRPCNDSPGVWQCVGWFPRDSEFATFSATASSTTAHVRTRSAGVGGDGGGEGDDSGDEGVSTNSTTIPCRAYHKLEEACYRYSHVLPTWMRPSSSSPACTVTDDVSRVSKVGVDVGAAPGGWSQFLAKYCNTVYAIDPGKLHPDVAALPNVMHLPYRVLPSTTPTTTDNSDSVQVCASGRVVERLCDAFSSRVPFIAVLTCDAILPPGESVDLMLEFLPWLCEGATLVLTLKLHSRSEVAIEKVEGCELARLRPYFPNITSHWLLSNKLERTLVGNYATTVVSSTDAK